MIVPGYFNLRPEDNAGAGCAKKGLQRPDRVPRYSPVEIIALLLLVIIIFISYLLA